MARERISPIIFKGQEIDRGIILGKQSFNWLFKKKNAQIWAKNGRLISALSPHKKNKLIYIPADEIKPKTILTINKGVLRYKVKINKIHHSSVEVDLLHDVPNTDLNIQAVTI
jgi:hypothetical protein